jgi:hypothetical protein
MAEIASAYDEVELPREKPSRVSFGELAYAWADRGDPVARRHYEDLRAAFELTHGEMRDCWFCPSSGMAVAMTTVDPRPAILRRQRLDLYTETEPLVRDHPEVAPVLHRAELRYVSVHNALRGLGQRHLVNWLFVWMRDLMILAAPKDSDGPRVPLSESALAPFHDELDDMAAVYDRAASSEARILYLGGMLAGLAALCVLLVPIGLLLPNELPIDRTLFFGSVIAGALGALVSVVTRMSAEKFQVRHEVGRTYIQRVAAFRPFIGSVFGLVVYLALTGGVIEQIDIPSDDETSFAFYLVLAFAAGFSERLVKEVIRAAEGGAQEPDRPERLQVELVQPPPPEPLESPRSSGA